MAFHALFQNIPNRLKRIQVWAFSGSIYDISQPGLVRGTVALLENSLTVRKKEQHKRMEVITQKLYVQNCIKEDCCQVIYSQFGLAIHPNDHQARRRFVGWAQNEIAVVPDFHKRILFSDEAHFWLNGYVNKQNCRVWSEANPQVYVETPLHPEKLTVWCALWAGGILLQKR
ncbi:hypothetical protein TNCV_3125221 [Trichonephila clavipes]|nr:hypothetical protein TNCV_3125221 [Trichonephila clavipes]